jgi:Cu(I)/Ag(I) efflux system membrane fusion protein
MEEAIYVVYCPMAFDNKGAHWLSEGEAVANPYFGQSMLGCGDIQKKLGTSHYRKDIVQKSIHIHQH